MLSLLLMQLALGQSADVRAPVAVVITSRRPGAEATAPKIAQRVLDSFKREGVAGLLDDAATARELRAAGFSDPRSCQGTRACVSKLAILLGPRAVVVGIDVGKVGKTLAIHLEAVASDRNESLGTLDVSASLNEWSDAMSVPIVVFVRDVKAGLELKKKAVAITSSPPPPLPPLEVARTDAPTKTELVPAPRSEASVSGLVEQNPGKPPRVAAWVFAGSAAATAGVAVAFGVMSGGARAQFDASLIDLGDGTQGSRLPEDQARALANSANTNAAVALTSGILSAGLTAAAAVFFLKD